MSKEVWPIFALNSSSLFVYENTIPEETGKENQKSLLQKRKAHENVVHLEIFGTIA